MTALVHYVLLSIAFCFVKVTVKLIWILKNDLSYILKQECHQSLQVDFFLNVYFFFLIMNVCVHACVGVCMCVQKPEV